MGKYINTAGIVLRETVWKDSSKILTVLTDSEGKLTVTARGALRKNSMLASVAQLLAFSEMTIYATRDRWVLTEARSVEQFIGLRGDLVLLSLGSYFAELTEAAADEDSPNPGLLSLCLNALYALSEGIKAPGYIKPAFELRLMKISGYAPLLSRCSVCGREEPERASMDMTGGTIRCSDCAQSQETVISKGALSAMRYITGCDPKKLFSFTLSSDALRELSLAAEEYLLVQLDRRFRTLEFYKSIG